MVLLTCGCDPETGAKCLTGLQLRKEYAIACDKDRYFPSAATKRCKGRALHALHNHLVYEEPAS